MREKPTDPKEFVEWAYENYESPYDLPVNDLNEKIITFKEDHISIIEIIKENNIKTIYEIGTSAGYTALLMSLYHGVEKVKTIDPWELKTTGMCVSKNNSIEFVKASSFNVSIKDDIGKYDMIFIDGDHELTAVISDTRMAFALEPKVIVWHDYGSDLPNGYDIWWPYVEQGISEYRKRIGSDANCDFGRQFKFDIVKKPRIIAYSIIK